MVSRKKTKKRVTKKKINPKQKFKFNRRSAIRIGIATALTIPAYIAFSSYSKKQANLHDLSTIGQGKPVLVQIHDPQCSKCRKLLSSVYSVLDEFPEIEFRIANIRSDKGYRFSRQHDVSNVTLLYFNDQGRKKDVAIGLQEQAAVRSFLDRMRPG